MSNKIDIARTELNKVLAALDKRNKELSTFKAMPPQALVASYNRLTQDNTFEKYAPVIQDLFKQVQLIASSKNHDGKMFQIRKLGKRSVDAINLYKDQLVEIRKNATAASDIVKILLDLGDSDPAVEKVRTLQERVDSLPPSQKLFPIIGIERDSLPYFLKEKLLVATQKKIQSLQERLNKLQTSAPLPALETPPAHEEFRSVSPATLAAVEIDLPTYEEEDALKEILTPLERFEQLLMLFEERASKDPALLSAADAEVKTAIEETIREQQEVEVSAARKIATEQLLALGGVLKKQATPQPPKANGKENSPDETAITDLLFASLPPGVRRFIQNKVLIRENNPAHFDPSTLIVLPFSIWPGSREEKRQWLDEARESLNALDVVRTNSRASEEMRLRYDLLLRSNPALTLKAAMENLLFISVVLNLGEEGLKDSSLRLAQLRKQKCFFMISGEKLSIAERVFFHLHHIHKNAKGMENPWTDPDFESRVFASHLTTTEARVRSAQRTLIELQLHILECALKKNNRDLQHKTLKTMECLRPSPDDLPEGVDNIARHLFTTLYTLFKRDPERFKDGLDPDARVYKGDFGRAAFQNTVQVQRLVTLKLQAIAQLREQLAKAWKITD